MTTVTITQKQTDSLPADWQLVEEYDNNFIFENYDKSFCVTIEFTPQFDSRYFIGFSQLKGTFTMLGIESGAYGTHAENLEDAWQKAVTMMLFIKGKIESCN